MTQEKNTDMLAELKKLPNWVAWELKPRRDSEKCTKIPLNPKTGSGAKSNDATTWATYDEAVSMANENARKQGLHLGQNHGVGFEFGEAENPSGYAGIDLDHVILEDGTLKPFAREIVDIMDTYTEYSPSERGLHILFKLPKTLPAGIRHRDEDIGIELYDSLRYFTVTERVFEEPKPIAERLEALRKVYSKYLDRKEAKKESQPSQPVNYQSVEVMTDSELWQKIFDSRNGYEIQALYNGNISGYDSQSQADLALCNHLAFWTGNDAIRIDSMFRQSGLMREKWDQKHGAHTYGAITIEKAIRETSRTYTPPMNESTRTSQSKSEKPESQPQEKDKVSQAIQVKYIPQYLTEKLESDIGRFQKYANLKTGFSNLDAKMSLNPGLFVVGAVSSLGKTTFIHQLGDQLARMGEHVLFFILEQTELELVTKGLSRLTAQENFSTAVSSIDIRAGRITDSVRRAIAEYKRIAQHEAIIEGSFDTTITDITETVQTYIDRYKVRPIIIVDYLQLIRPIDPRQTTKEAVDSHVRALKKLQMKNDLVIFLISSLNRQNYLTTVDYESFKESGGIEFTADVIFGLQLYVMNSDIFDEEKKLKTKRDLVKAAKREIPRQIELCILKNRYGSANDTCRFEYYPQFDLFIPVEVTENSHFGSGINNILSKRPKL